MALVQFGNQAKKIAQKELETLIAAGRARSRTYAEYKQGRSKEEEAYEKRSIENLRRIYKKAGIPEKKIDEQLARVHVYSPDNITGGPAAAMVRRGDTYYYADRRELPKFQETKAIEAALLVQLAVDILTFFRVEEAIGEASSSELANTISESLLAEHQ